MGRGLSYADAVVLLGGQRSRTVEALDRLAGGALLAASAAGAGFALSLFDAKSEFAKLGAELVVGLGDRLRGLRRFDRTERLAAAHSVIAVTAFFEAFDGPAAPFDAADLGLTDADRAAIAGVEGGGAPAAMLLRTAVPMPEPHRPYERNLAALTGFYTSSSGRLLHLITGLAVWDRLDERRRGRLREALGALPQAATRRYEELFRRLAAECPELGFWANQVDHRATRARLDELAAGLAGIERILAGIARGRAPDERRLALARAYRAQLDRPILAAEQDYDGPVVPRLGDGYVNPRFRVGHGPAADQVCAENWWEGLPVREDLQEFLLGHLTSPRATETPLLLLGQPGSGKSVLTKVLAARLPPTEFLVVRVVLREVPADADLQSQLEYAIRAATGERLSWPELARSAADAMPVVLLDGFDELLQATGVSQSGYLERIEAFQHREADQGRPVVALVTSRTAVAGRARPVPGMVAVRLEPFDQAQVGRWLDVWNAVNAGWLNSRGRRPLLASAIRRYGPLAEQPLLLLMLALYDADRDASSDGDGFEKADLYERLLTLFAEREVRKSGAALSEEQRRLAVDHELLRLSVVALAMFNRHRQWVTEAELDADLAALLGDPATDRSAAGLRAELTRAQVVIGRFFFVHQAQAIRDDTTLRTYEFLHATFGEYLIARIVVGEMTDLAEDAELRTVRRRARTDDGFLYAILSFVPLTMRGMIGEFAAAVLRRGPGARRERLRRLALALFRDSLESRPPGPHDGYRPNRLTAPARAAAYSANLVLLAALAGDDGVTARELFPAGASVVQWRNMAMLWRSQLPAEGWSGLLDELAVDRSWAPQGRQLTLRPADEELYIEKLPVVGMIDLRWTHGIGRDYERLTGNWYLSWSGLDVVELATQQRWLCDPGDDALLHALEPLLQHLGPAVVAFHYSHALADGAVSAAHALVRLWFEVSEPSDPPQLAERFDVCLEFGLCGFAPDDHRTRSRFLAMVFQLLTLTRDRLPTEWLTRWSQRITAGVTNPASAGPPVVVDLAYLHVPWLLELRH